MNDLIGRTLGPYQIVQAIGQGGMASVYKAYQPALQRYVAIKVLPAHLAQDTQFSERFTREARAIARLDHPNILPVHDFGQTDGVTYIVMKYVDGGTLQVMLEHRKLPLTQAALVLGQLASALDYAHGQGIVHRDIKPANVLLARPDWVLLSDFGLAKLAEATVKLTLKDASMGTPEFMAPEQAHGREIDARADIYSLGVTLYAMVTGQVPYTGDTPLAIILKHINEPIPTPRAINPALPPAAEAAILKALAKEPGDRPSTAGELSRAFSVAIAAAPAAEAVRPDLTAAPVVSHEAHGATILEPPPSVPSQTAPPYEPASFAPEPPSAVRRRSTPWVWIAAAVVAVVLCLGTLSVGGLAGGFLALTARTATPEPPTVAPTPLASPKPLPSATPPPLPSAVPTEYAVPNEGWDHIPIGAPGTWAHSPPTSGQHYPQAANWGFYTKQVPPEYFVHNLEHGGIVILYQCPTACEGTQNALKQFFQTTAPDAAFHEVKLVIGPDPGIGSPVVAVAWDWELDLPDVNTDLLLDFYNRHVNQGRELVP